MPLKPAEDDVVLIVDDVPQNLAMLADALDDAGYTVIVATSGEGALDRLRRVTPDVILLDAVMPGLDGFETCRRIKTEPATSAIPVIFMTGLSETQHVVQGFAAGGTDYVTKPIRIEETLARIAAHVRNARLAHQARAVVDALGFGVVVLDRHGNPSWVTPRAGSWLAEIDAAGRDIPETLGAWAARQMKANTSGSPTRSMRLPFATAGRQLLVHYLGSLGDDERLVLLQEQHDDNLAASLQTSYNLTRREVEVLMWVAKGKTSKDIGNILGMSPRTVDKHLEHVYVKLGVETRAAAAALTISARSGPQATWAERSN